MAEEEGKVVALEFSIKDIGSATLTRFSDDMYDTQSIVRELVKNATDSYYELEEYCSSKSIPLPADYDRDRKEINIGTHKDTFVVTDRGIGCDVDSIRKLIKIGVSDKKDIPGTTGFRGVGFWAAFSAGEKITVISSKYGSKEKCKLEINTQRIRDQIDPKVDIGTILNDQENIFLF